MKITVSQPDLNNALKRVLPATGRNSVMPILTFVKLIAKGDKLTLETTDLHIGIETSIEAEVLVEGSIAVPCKLLQTYIKNVAKTKPVEIEVVGNELHVKCGASETSFNTMKHDEFPNTPDLNEEIVEFEQSTLKNMLDKTAFATSQDESKPFLCGVLLKIEDEELVSISTDTFRLSAIKSKVGFDKELDIILPTVTADILNKELSSGIGKFMTNGDLIRFKINDTIITSRIINGQFPNYKQVIPRDNNIEIKVDSGDLKEAIKRILAVSDKESILLIDVEDEIMIQNTKENKARVKEIVECEASDSLKIAVNGKYLMDYLNKIDGDIMIKGKSGLAPLRVDLVDDDKFVYILMPIRR